MKVANILGRKKPTVLPAELKNKVQDLLLNMNAKTQYNETNRSFDTKILSCLKTPEGSIIDSSFIVKPVSSIYEGRASISLGEKLNVTFDPNSGKIIKANKKWFVSWNKSIEKMTDFITKLKTNFDNENIVEKRFLNFSGFTPNGRNKLENIN